MNARALGVWAVILAVLCSGALAAPKGPIPPPPPPTGAPAPGAVRCNKCNGQGWKWDDGRWKPCNNCNGAGWLYPGGSHPGGPGPWYPRHRGGHEGDFCFVATAAYGTPWEPNVATLRTFRDDCLMTSPVGRGFVSLYYSVSPPLAEWIADHPWARAATRVALTPLVIVAGALEGNPADIGIVAGAIALGYVFLPPLRKTLRRRRAARRAAA